MSLRLGGFDRWPDALTRYERNEETGPAGRRERQRRNERGEPRSRGEDPRAPPTTASACAAADTRRIVRELQPTRRAPSVPRRESRTARLGRRHRHPTPTAKTRKSMSLTSTTHLT